MLRLLIFVLIAAISRAELDCEAIDKAFRAAAENNETVKPKYLSIERSFLALLRENALGTIGPRLHGLYLRNNHLKGVNRSMLQGLTSLRELDLSGNRISSLVTGVFDLTPELRELTINDNDITIIEEGTFAKLTSLKKLSLSGNQISIITKNMFKGLDSLEVLDLQNNQITSIDWSAFANLKQLRTLDLGTNHFTNVELRGLENLQKLFLNNNSINSLKKVSLRDLPSLILLSLDRNSISEIADGDLSGLARSTRLESLTIAANNISQVTNAWQCVCGEEWLGDWLEKAGDSDVGDGVLGCLVTAARRCAVDPQMETDEVRSVWVTVTASILAAVSLLILVAIAFLYITDGKQRVVLMRPLVRRTDSDLHKLIADVDPLIARDLGPPRKIPSTGEKKRVRFEDN
ncbi:hypothetical protein GCK32_006229 [Trichostrongylus colubriformis]|uniref:Uncharacterized protein n=1 Tax=Trichostrongylus colubriformis TaxID=6319 RepID=A0AAN8F4R1_TRICO